MVDPDARTLNCRSIQSWPPDAAAVRAAMKSPSLIPLTLTRVLGDAPPQCIRSHRRVLGRQSGGSGRRLSTAPDSSRRSERADQLLDQGRWLKAEFGLQELAKVPVLA